MPPPYQQDAAENLLDPCSTPPRHGAAEAVTDDAQLLARQVISRCLDVLHQIRVGKLHADVTTSGNVILRIASFKVALRAVIHRRSHHGVARRAKTVGHIPDMVVDAKNLLHHDHAFGGIRGPCDISRKAEAVGGFQLNCLTHNQSLPGENTFLQGFSMARLPDPSTAP